MYHCIYVSQYLYITPILYPAFTVFLYHHHSVIGIFLCILCPCQCSRVPAAAMAQDPWVICVVTASIGCYRGRSLGPLFGQSSSRATLLPETSRALCIIWALPSLASRVLPPCSLHVVGTALVTTDHQKIQNLGQNRHKKIFFCPNGKKRPRPKPFAGARRRPA